MAKYVIPIKGPEGSLHPHGIYEAEGCPICDPDVAKNYETPAARVVAAREMTNGLSK